MKRILLIVIVSLCCSICQGRNMRIGIFSNQTLKSLLIKAVTADYEVFSNGKKVFNLEDNILLTLTLKDDQIVASYSGTELGSFTNLRFRSLSRDAVFRIKPLNPSLNEGIF